MTCKNTFQAPNPVLHDPGEDDMVPLISRSTHPQLHPGITLMPLSGLGSVTTGISVYKDKIHFNVISKYRCVIKLSSMSHTPSHFSVYMDHDSNNRFPEN